MLKGVINLYAKQRYEIFRRFSAANPSPTTELHYTSEFELLIAVILSAQATDKRVNLVTKQLFSIANTPEKMLLLGEQGLKEYIKSIGLFNSKAKNIIRTCQMLVDNHHAKLPRHREQLEALPGVGRKTANVILNTLFGKKTIAVDTHIFRVANRTGLARGKNVLSVEKGLEKNIPAVFKRHAHHWLVLHGRYVCIARKPKCPECLICDLCEYENKTEY